MQFSGGWAAGPDSGQVQLSGYAARLATLVQQQARSLSRQGAHRPQASFAGRDRLQDEVRPAFSAPKTHVGVTPMQTTVQWMPARKLTAERLK